MKIKWTEQDFINATGRKPISDDLERVNCKKAGKSGHWQCGVCHDHNMPVFMCHKCVEDYGIHPPRKQ